MAKFCVYCGKQLEDGAECDCAQSQVAKQAQAQQQQAQAYQQQAQAYQQQAYQQAQQQQAYQQPYVAPAPNPAVQAIGAAFKSLTTIVNKPIESLQAFVKAQNFIAALILIGGQALVAAFFTIALAGSLKMGEIVNLAAVFFETFAFSLVLSAVLFGMIFLLTIIFKGKTDAKTLFCVVAVRSVIVIPFMVLGLLIGLANAELASDYSLSVNFLQCSICTQQCVCKRSSGKQVDVCNPDCNDNCIDRTCTYHAGIGKIHDQRLYRKCIWRNVQYVWKLGLIR